MFDAKKYIPGLGGKFKIAGDELNTDPGAIPRATLTEDSLAKHGVDLFTLKQPTGIGLTATLAAGLHATLVASHVRTIVGELADGNTKTSVSHFEYILPDSYVAGGDITLRVAAKLKSVTGSGVADNGSDTDASAYKQAHGAVGSDLVATAAQVYAALDTWYDKDFVVTPTGLVAGDVLNFEITQRAIENDAGNGSLQSYIGEVSVLCDVKG